MLPLVVTLIYTDISSEHQLLVKGSFIYINYKLNI